LVRSRERFCFVWLLRHHFRDGLAVNEKRIWFLKKSHIKPRTPATSTPEAHAAAAFKTGPARRSTSERRHPAISAPHEITTTLALTVTDRHVFSFDMPHARTKEKQSSTNGKEGSSKSRKILTVEPECSNELDND